MNIEDKTTPLSFGDMILIPPNTPHRPVINDKESLYERFIFWISEDFMNSLIQTSSDYGYVTDYVKESGKHIFSYGQIEFNAIRAKIISLLEELQLNRFGKNERVGLEVKDLLLHINRTIYEQNHPVRRQIGTSLYQNVMYYIDDHLDEPLSLDILAEKFFVSKYHISHTFKENLGISVHQYILKKRLSNSRDAILFGSDISKVYELFGFNDYTSFYRAFKKEYGMSPLDYKKKYLQFTNP